MMGNRRLALGLVGMLVLAMGCRAQSASAPRRVDLTASDGTKLKATYFAAAGPGPGVLLLHQCNQDRKGWDGLAGKLAGAGIHVLTMDYRGFGESGGTPVRGLQGAEFIRVVAEKWPGDIDAAEAYLRSQPGVTPGILGAGGASCGVNQAIQLAWRRPEVKSLVLLSGDTDANGRTFLRKEEQIPILFSAADDDPGAVEMITWLYGLSPNPGNKFLHYTTGGHGVNLFAAHPELAGIIVDWFVETLITTPGKAPAGERNAAAKKLSRILELIDSPGGAQKAGKELAEARKKDRKASLFSEEVVNVIGYEHLQAGDNRGAIEIMKLNAEAYPNSPNVYDSLSDAYLAEGKTKLASENAKKALQLLANDTVDDAQRREMIQGSAEAKLKQLGEKP